MTPLTLPPSALPPYYHSICLSRLGRGLLGRVAAQLGLRSLLGGALGALDGRDTLNGVLAEVGTVASLGGLVGNGLVGPVLKHHVSLIFSVLSCLLASPRIRPPREFSVHSLAGRLVARDLSLGESLGGLGRVLDGLAEDSETTVGVGDDTNSLYSSF